MIPLYNHAGDLVACADDDCQALYRPDGKFVAWFDGELVYSPTGRYLGWVQHGWLYDRTGHPALFADNASGGPHRPKVCNLAPPNLDPHPPQYRPTPKPRPAKRHLRQADWSPRSGLAYFAQ